MNRPTANAGSPIEAVVSIDWAGHRLLYIEAILIEATRQNRRQLVIVDTTALKAPDWYRVERLLGDEHQLLTVDFKNAKLKQALPQFIERLIILEGDPVLPQMLNLLRVRKGLSSALLLMREPGVVGPASARRVTTVNATKRALITILHSLFRSRCEIHVLRSPLFPPSSVTQNLAAAGRCSVIVDPVLKANRNRTDSGTELPSDRPPTVLVAGRLDIRKSLKELLAVWPDPALANYRLALRGEVHHEHFDDLLDEATLRGAAIDVDDRHLSDDELHDAFVQATAVLCLHKWSLPSGVAALAIDAGCPVVGFAHTNLGKAIVSKQLGAVVDRIEGQQLAEAIDRCRSLPRSDILDRANALHANATTEHFSAQLLGARPS